MLVLSRKIDEAIIIEVPRACTLRIIVTGKNRQGTRIGFECPDDVQILREELITSNQRPTQIIAAKETVDGPHKVA